MLYPIVCSTVENKLLLVQGKKTISLTEMISRKPEMHIFQTTLLKFTNNSDISLVE